MEAAVKIILKTNLFKPTGGGGGGCISTGLSYETDFGTVFVKTNDKPNALNMLEGEKVGLFEILKTKTVRCPKPLKIVEHGSSVALVMESLNMSSLSRNQEELLGEQLARMHLHNKVMLDKYSAEEGRIHSGEAGDSEEDSKPVTKFGFYVPTSCGYLSQDNTWQDDWTTFFVRQKLQAQVDMLLEKKADRELLDLWPICRRKIEDQLSKVENIIPALIHGDLWSGNVASADNLPVIYDPAVFYGHSEYDFGIANMFGGFSSSFYKSYFKINPKADGFSQRENIYELFHHLNHWNHFGSGYKGSTISLMKTISKF